MKKLNLKKLKLEASDKLQRDQLKTIVGGYGPECYEPGSIDIFRQPLPLSCI